MVYCFHLWVFYCIYSTISSNCERKECWRVQYQCFASFSLSFSTQILLLAVEAFWCYYFIPIFCHDHNSSVRQFSLSIFIPFISHSIFLLAPIHKVFYFLPLPKSKVLSFPQIKNCLALETSKLLTFGGGMVSRIILNVYWASA